MKKIEPSKQSELKGFTLRLSQLYIEAGRLEIFKTRHKINEAIVMAGYEAASQLGQET